MASDNLPATAPTTLPDLRPSPQAVARARGQVNLRDRASVLSYGEEAQREVSSFAGTMLSTAKSKDTGPVGELLTQLILQSKGLDASELDKLGLLDRLRGGMEAKVVRFKERCSAAEGQVDRIELQLNRHLDALKRDIVMLDGLYQRNLDRLIALEAYVVAGKEAIAEARDVELPALRARAEAADGEGIEAQLLAQQVSDLAQSIERFEKRVRDLRLSRTNALQTMPQIKLIQYGDDTLADKMQSAITTVIPIWKNGLALALALQRRDDALAFADALDERTNEMLRRNAARLKTGAIAIEASSQRGVIDVETLAQVNREFIETIEGVLAIQREGKARRDEAERELVRIERELRVAVTGGKL